MSENGPVLIVDSDPLLRSEVIATLARAQIKQVIAADDWFSLANRLSTPAD